MTLPDDRCRCNPQAQECKQREQCARLHTDEKVMPWLSVSDFSWWLESNMACVMYIRDEK